MPYKTSEGKTLVTGRKFTIGSVQYPGNFLTAAGSDALEAAGITWEEPPKLKDERWYYNRVKDGEVTSEPKPLDQLKERETANAKKQAGALLSGSDWMVIRSVDEEERPVPVEWSAFRDAVRVECNRLEEAIASADFEGIQSLKPEWPNDPNWKEPDA